MDPKISPNQDQLPSGSPPRCTAVPGPPPDELTVPVENHSCDRKTSGPTASAEPASPLAGGNDPAPSGYPTFAPLRPAWGFLPASPAAVHRSRSASVPGWLASAA